MYISLFLSLAHAQNNRIIIKRSRYESTHHRSKNISEAQRGRWKSWLQEKVLHWENVWGGVYLKQWDDRGWRQEEEWEERELHESGRGWIRRRARVKIIKRGGMEGRAVERGGGLWNGNRMWSCRSQWFLEPVRWHRGRQCVGVSMYRRAGRTRLTCGDHRKTSPALLWQDFSVHTRTPKTPVL